MGHTRMKTEIKQLWIEALESGKYKQGKKNLKNVEGTFCCLGVLCDIYAKTQKKKGWSEHNQFAFKFGKQYANTAGLPDSVMKWSGIKSSLGYYGDIYHTGDEALAFDNDHGKSFKEIVKIIDEKF